MSEHRATQKSRSGVFLLPTDKLLAEHELAAHKILGEKIATLLSSSFSGIFDQRNQIPGTAYFIPRDTLIGLERARALGIKNDDDFFGGIVARPFMATKAISHALLHTNAHAPLGWSERFSKKTLGVVLKGFTTFNLNDTLQAGIQLLLDGPIRIKPVRACAGRGQTVVTNRNELVATIATLNEDEVSAWGLVLEENLDEVTTFSVGQVKFAGITVSYIGTQHLTRDNDGETVYGGSTLDLVRGDYAQLSQLNLSDNEQLAISQAINYEAAAFSCFPEMIASRRNYDIAQGLDSSGEFCSGVLEQSWRIGGASGAEIFALEAFVQDDALQFLRASTHEVYGVTELPQHTAILYSGEDPDVGFITKYVKVESYGDKN